MSSPGDMRTAIIVFAVIEGIAIAAVVLYILIWK